MKMSRGRKIRQITKKVPEDAKDLPSIIVKESRRSGVVVYWSLYFHRSYPSGWSDYAHSFSIDRLRKIVGWAFSSAKIDDAPIYEIKT